MFEKVQVFEDRYEELSEKLCDPATVSDPEKYAQCMKEYKSVEPLALKYREYKKASADKQEAEELLEENSSDREMKEMLEEEIASLGADISALEEELKILLEAEDVEVNIDPTELKIDTFRASGAGGQHINKTESAIRITHLPTGLVVECQDERSQYKNKDKAMKVLRSRLLEAERERQQSEVAAQRHDQVGTGDRSERIRTYNYPQGRVTDHRIGLTLYKIDDILNGSLDEIIDPLITAARSSQLGSQEN